MRISRIGAAILVAGSIGLASPALAQMGDHHGQGDGDHRGDGDHHDNGGDHHGGNWSGQGNHHGSNWSNHGDRGWHGGHRGWNNGWHRHCWWTWRHHHRVRVCR
jgi:hypothetical protein